MTRWAGMGVIALLALACGSASSADAGNQAAGAHHSTMASGGANPGSSAGAGGAVATGGTANGNATGGAASGGSGSTGLTAGGHSSGGASSVGSSACAPADAFTEMMVAPMDLASFNGSATNSVALGVGSMLAYGSDVTPGVYTIDNDTWSRLDKPMIANTAYNLSGVITGDYLTLWAPDAQQGSGALLDLSNDTWTAMDVTGAPDQNSDIARAVVGGQFLEFGGDTSQTDFGVAVRFDPVANKWSTAAAPAALSARFGYALAAAGDALLVWGGFTRVGGNLATNNFPDQPVLGDGMVLDAGTWQWRSANSNGAPPARAYPITAWTGSELVVYGGFAQVKWGGYGAQPLTDGFRYNPQADTWTPMSSAGAPAFGSTSAVAMWSGERLVVWGDADDMGTTSVGGVYDPATDTWSPMDLTNAPPGRTSTQAHATAWGEIVVAGTTDVSVYNPTNNAWRKIPVDARFGPRVGVQVVWLGDRLVIWGGSDVFTDTAICNNNPGIPCDPPTEYTQKFDGVVLTLACP